MKNKIFYGILPLLFIISSCSLFKENSKPSTVVTLSKDTTEIAKRIKPNAIQPFAKVISKNAITKTGLFAVHEVDGKYFFEIPDSLFGRAILVVTRFIKTPAGAPKYGGEEIGSQTVYWEKGPANKIFLRVSTIISMADSTDAIAKAVNNSNVTPIIEAFEVKARNEITQASVIEVTDFINNENALFALGSKQKDELGLGTLEKDKSYISKINTYPTNTEIKTVKTYKAKIGAKDLPAAAFSGMITIEVNNSMILLPKVPMKKRFYDERVGYFATAHYDYSDKQQKVTMNAFVKRWRLEPKAEDLQRWKNGELVEPKQPIVFYIDPATPEKWVDYLIEGINDWQVAFEAAGFKNAIIGKRWDNTRDSLSLEDARYSVIRYFASPVKNAYGPSVVDPRSGEIIESHIGWYHNVMSLLSSWYMIQAGAVDERARKIELDPQLMGQLIRFVSSHEVGHTLGLRHNMGASYATPVEKLRDAAWLKKNGHTASIMDYARFNYVAQPEDHISPDLLMPRINDYDKWAIKWGYHGLYNHLDGQKEKEMLSQQVTDSLAKNARLWFGGEGRDYDPRSQAEDLGDNAMLASAYGIKNLKRIVPQLIDWTKQYNSDDYSNLEEVYDQVVAQYSRYINHVIKNIGGTYVTPKTVGQKEDIYTSVPKSKQKEALLFLDKYAFNEPMFLVNNDILNKIQLPQSKKPFNKVLEGVIMSLIGSSRISRMNFIAERYDQTNPYRPTEFVQDVSDLIWKELDNNQPINSYRRSLQLIYLENMISVYSPKKAVGIQALLAMLGDALTSYTDVSGIALNNLLNLQVKIKKTLINSKDPLTKAHLKYLDRALEKALSTL